MIPPIQDVWRSDLDEAFNTIAQLVEDDYNYVAIDTEFPGIVLGPSAADPLNMTTSAINFLQLRANVNKLKIIQLGLSFSDANGNKPPGMHTYQFNFEFNLERDLYADDSINLLKDAGIKFEKHASGLGIGVEEFGEKLMSSGLVLNEDVHWISFHGMYDFGYLLQLLMNKQVPDTPVEFFEQLKAYFPNITDVKYQKMNSFRGSLQALAKSVGAKRIGPNHQAGSDSLLTTDIFFRLSEKIRSKSFDGKLFGLNKEDKFWKKPPPKWNANQARKDGATGSRYEQPIPTSWNGATQTEYHDLNWDYSMTYTSMDEELKMANQAHHVREELIHRTHPSMIHANHDQANISGLQGQDDLLRVNFGRTNWNRCGGSSSPYIGTKNGYFGQSSSPYFSQHMGPPVDPPLA